MADETDFSTRTWSYLAGNAEVGQRGQGAVVEAMRRVVVALDGSEKSAHAVGHQMWWLTLWLLVFTVVIGALTGVLVWLEFHGGSLR
jgi:hypothetical protein